MNFRWLKKRYVWGGIPLVLLAADFFVYEQVKKLAHPQDAGIIRLAFGIGTAAAAIAVVLLFAGIGLLLRQNREKTEIEYADEIVRKFFVPVNGIIGLANQLGEANRNQQPQPELLLITQSAVRLKRLLTDTEQYHLLRERKVKLEYKTVNLYDMVEVVLRKLAEGIPEGVALHNDTSAGLFVRVDPLRMQEALGNILVVFLNFTVKGNIRVAAKEKANSIQLAILNDGIGIAPNVKEIIFEPFQGANNISNVHYSGTGFSLAIAKEIVSLHKSRIWIDKSLTDTSACYMLLQKSDEHKREAFGLYGNHHAGRDPGGVPRTLNPEGPQKGRVLLIKTDSVHKHILMSYIRAEGYAVDAPGIQQIRLDYPRLSKKYDLLIIDELFERSSFELCCEVRREFGLTQLPVLLMVPNDRQGNLQRAYEAGANDCIDYMVLRQQFVAKINTLVQIKQATDELLDVQVRFLQAQIQPHFLYNALNAITQLSLENPAAAHEVLLDFGSYLRSKFNFRNYERGVPVSEELATVRSYLNVEKARFGERLSFTIQLEGEGDRLIPALSIQPFVENAVKHGAGKLAKGGTLEVLVKQEPARTTVHINDNGPGMGNAVRKELLGDGATNLGTGFSNAAKRLRMNGCTDLQITSGIDAGTTVSFSLPVMKGEQAWQAS